MKPVFFSAPERCVSRDDALVGRLVELWEASVRATHDFLREEDIRGIRTYVPDALRSIADLRIVRDAEGVPVAFMGCDGRRLEMLFVDPTCRGAGVGTALVREAFAAGVTEVVVNEQNPSARGFYEHVGFAVCGRSERDEQGGPFPILYMKLNDNNKPNMEKAIAKDLLSIGAVFLRPEQPFTWASGIKSPIYCDNRLTL
uniref:GNAT family N-acetyltransferase n=1 Tax=Alistipes communis TaxID=2585118 RepID=UPI003078382F